jgi:hypothetical protein
MLVVGCGRRPAAHPEFAAFLFPCGWPNRVELSHEPFCIALSFALCRKGVEGFVSHLLIFVNIPAEAIGIPDIFYDIGRKDGPLCHDRIVRQRRLLR